jgi:hypothetical protein
MTKEDSVMVKGKARWLLDGGIDDLGADELAILLAMLSLDVGTGRKLTDEEQKLFDQILARSGVGGEEISRAVKQVIEAKPKKNQQLDWSDLKKPTGHE